MRQRRIKPRLPADTLGPINHLGRGYRQPGPSPLRLQQPVRDRASEMFVEDDEGGEEDDGRQAVQLEAVFRATAKDRRDEETRHPECRKAGRSAMWQVAAKVMSGLPSTSPPMAKRNKGQRNRHPFMSSYQSA